MSKRIADVVTELVGPKVSELGYELADVEFQKEGQDYVLTVYIYSPNGITIDDCETVSRTIEPLIDEADPIEQFYFLSVSSLGLDRPLKHSRDFERHMGKRVTVKLFAPLNKQSKTKEYTGELLSYDENKLSIEIDGQMMEFNCKEVAQVKPFVDFS